ncbi:transposase domain-containing protein, partial [Paraburkholderia sp. LEh10]|uniref:transposase domain-containing protein n=1 Tax=Paraburkholderia sp. LEh10 TaxID=2821353 RepID=UPI001FD7DC92
DHIADANDNGLQFPARYGQNEHELAISRSNWLFAGSLRAGQRAAAIMSLIRTAQLNGHDPYVYLKDVLNRLPTQRADDIAQLLPHRWAPAVA